MPSDAAHKAGAADSSGPAPRLAAPSRGRSISRSELVVSLLIALMLFVMTGVLLFGVVLPRTCPHMLPSICNGGTLCLEAMPHEPSKQHQELALAIAAVACCLLPWFLSLGAAMLATWQQQSRFKHQFIAAKPTWDSEEEKHWKSSIERTIQSQWKLEALRSTDAQSRMVQYAGLFGFMVAASLTSCAMVLNKFPRLDITDGKLPVAMAPSLACAVLAATAGSFCINLGRIMVRATRRDASTRMFAWAARSQLLVILATVLLVCMLAQSRDEIVKTWQGFVLVGLTVAVFGEQALLALADRAANVLNLSRPKAQASMELRQIQGIGEEEIERLGEEGIDTLHALAFMPAPQLYFGTPYSLQRILDWQDQALLIIYTGTKAPIFREQLLIRGAMDAQRMIEWCLFEEKDKLPTTERKPDPEREKAVETVSKALGFSNDYQARAAMHTMAGDEVIHRLRVYVRGRIDVFDAVGHGAAAHPPE